MNFEKQFKREVSYYSNDELLKIVRESLDFYSDEEVKIIKEELTSRNISSSTMHEINEFADDYIRSCQNQEIDKKIENQKQERQHKEDEHRIALSVLQQSGAEGYWEYEVIDVIDKFGAVDTDKLKEKLNDLAVKGWHLKCAYSNELGKNAVSVVGLGINSSVDQNILIFERFVRFK